MGTLIKGYASVYGNADRSTSVMHSGGETQTPGGMITAPGAYSAFLAANPAAQRTPLLWHHNQKDTVGLPIGMTAAIAEDDFGLLFEGELADTRLGRDVAALMEVSDLGASLRFAGGKGRMNHETGVMTMEEAGFTEFTAVIPGDQINLLATVGLADTFKSEAPEVIAALAAVRETFEAAA